MAQTTTQEEMARGPVCCKLHSMPLTASGWRLWAPPWGSGWSQPSGSVGGTGNPGCLSGKTLWRFLESSSIDAPCAPAILPTGTCSKTHVHTTAGQEQSQQPSSANAPAVPERVTGVVCGRHGRPLGRRGRRPTRGATRRHGARREWTELSRDAPHRSHRNCPEEANPQGGVGGLSG